MKVFAALLVLSAVGLSSAQFGAFRGFLTTPPPKGFRGRMPPMIMASPVNNIAAASQAQFDAVANQAQFDNAASLAQINAAASQAQFNAAANQAQIDAAASRAQFNAAAAFNNGLNAVNQINAGAFQNKFVSAVNNAATAAELANSKWVGNALSVDNEVKGAFGKAKVKYDEAVEKAKAALDVIKNNKRYQQIKNQLENGIDAAKQTIAFKLAQHPALAANIEIAEEKIADGIFELKQQYQNKAAPFVNKGIAVAKGKLQEIEKDIPELTEKAGKIASGIKSSFGSQLKKWGIGV